MAKVVSALIISEYNKGKTELLKQLKKMPKIYDLKHGEKFVWDILSSLKGNDRDLLKLDEASPEEENVQNK